MVRLTDRIDEPTDAGVTKVRIVQLYPQSLSWVSTHVAGPCVHSQFRYTIEPLGRSGSVLNFQGREIRWEPHPIPPGELSKLRTLLRRADMSLWRHFAREMATDIRGSKGARS
jgi:hypothetical protein